MISLAQLPALMLPKSFSSKSANHLSLILVSDHQIVIDHFITIFCSCAVFFKNLKFFYFLPNNNFFKSSVSAAGANKYFLRPEFSSDLNISGNSTSLNNRIYQQNLYLLPMIGHVFHCLSVYWIIFVGVCYF